jgi:steroid 5-alpha reductase family enzyme
MPELMLWGAAALLLAVIMSLAWVVQYRTGQGAWVDVCWTFGIGLAGLLVALWPLAPGDLEFRQGAVAGLIALWSLRLGFHLVERALNSAPDERYEGLKRAWGAKAQPRLFAFLLLQAAAGALLVVSLLVAARNPTPGPTLQDLLAVLIMLIAMGGEATADRQLVAFKVNPANKGRICDTGLWAWSRHPNYFFEWLGWCAWPIMAIDATGQWPWGALALTAPIYMYWLLTRVSGVPPLEAHMKKTRPEAFAAYAARTSIFFPRPPKKDA